MAHDPTYDHSHDGGHAGHSHGVSADADRGGLTIALGLILGFMVFEVVAGVLAHSLALLSDAAHMLTDAAAIALALVALRLAARPAKGVLTYGLKRSKILSAQFNGATLSRANRQSMNVEGPFQHILTDLAAFILTAVAGVVILATGFGRADGIASLVIAAIMLCAAYGLLKASGRVFLEAAPEGIEPAAQEGAHPVRPGASR